MLSRVKVEEKQQWMSCPRDHITYPSLAHFCDLDQLIISETEDSIHTIITKDAHCCTIYNRFGEKVFVAIQDKNSKYRLRIYNFYGNEIVEVKKREVFAYEQALVWAPSGIYAGTIQRKLDSTKCYSVKTAPKSAVIKITSQSLKSMVLGSLFHIVSDGVRVGVIEQNEEAAGKQARMTFPTDMNVQLKAILLAACLLIDFLKN